MGRAKGKAENALSRQTGTIMDKAMSEEDLEDIIDFPPAGPDWRIPGDYHHIEASQFIRGGNDGVKMDQAVALRLLKLEYEGDTNKYKRWYLGSRILIPTPEETCAGMDEAGRFLIDTINNGEKISVFCDYDVDGTTSGEILRRSLEPYGAELHYGWADAKRGYGLTNEFVKQAHENGSTVLVTVDCGSTQDAQVAYAQSLGMKVMVVDHHAVSASNPADFHLNPGLPELEDKPKTSLNTGAQLAWQLGAAAQIAADDNIKEEHYQTTLNLAGMGCLADMGSVVLPENRAYFWGAPEAPALGVEVLAKKLGENPYHPGAMVRTQACMNLPKRTPKVDTADVGALLGATDEAEASKIADKLLVEYEKAAPIRKEMENEALAQTGEVTWTDDGVQRHNDKRVAIAIIKDEPDYAGYSGVVANRVASKNYSPAAVFCNKGKDEHGQEAYKFSTRNSGTSNKVLVGDLKNSEALAEACVMKVTDEAGETIEKASYGGHEDVFSGTCTAENVKKVSDAIEEWAGSFTEKQYWKPKYTGPDHFLSARKVSGERLTNIESDAARLGPFTSMRQESENPKKDREPTKNTNRPLEISVLGQLTSLESDEDSPNMLKGKLFLDNGDSREVRFPADETAPNGMCEWILKVDGNKSSPYYLRKFFKLVS